MRTAALILLLFPLRALALVDVSFDEHPGAAVPGLGDYYGRSPIVLVLGYLGCVNLCGATLTGVSEALRDTGLQADRDYTALFMSIDPRDEKAAPERRPGWHFLTGAAAGARVADAVGFRYRFEEESGQFAHPAGFVVLTPDGRVARYFEGVRFNAAELRDAIASAAKGEMQTSFERLLLVCFHDPLGAKNTAAVMNGVRIAMALLLLGAGFLAWRRLR